jgi:hypothetical protein
LQLIALFASDDEDVKHVAIPIGYVRQNYIRVFNVFDVIPGNFSSALIVGIETGQLNP